MFVPPMIFSLMGQFLTVSQSVSAIRSLGLLSILEPIGGTNHGCEVEAILVGGGPGGSRWSGDVPPPVRLVVWRLPRRVPPTAGRVLFRNLMKSLHRPKQTPRATSSPAGRQPSTTDGVSATSSPSTQRGRSPITSSSLIIRVGYTSIKLESFFESKLFLKAETTSGCWPRAPI